MKLKLLQSMAGIDFSHNVGDVIEVNDKDAVQRYIERGIAEPVETPKKETAEKKKVAARQGNERIKMPTLPLQHRVQLVTGPSVEPISVQTQNVIYEWNTR